MAGMADAWRQPAKVLGFWRGWLVGAVSTLILGGAYWVWDQLAHPPPGRPYYNAMVRTNGAILSARGGAVLVLRDGYDEITQSCRGRCDDLSLDDSDSPYGYKARLLDAKGACVACEWTTETRRAGMTARSFKGGGLTQTTPLSTE
jgi:hypothetical protein